MRQVILIALCAMLLGGGMAYGANYQLGDAYATLGASNSNIENAIRTMMDTTTTGGPFQVDSGRIYIDIVGTAAAGTDSMQFLVYESDSTFIGESNYLVYSWNTKVDGYHVFTFADPKPQLAASTRYRFGPWGDAVASATTNIRLNATGNNECMSYTYTFRDTPPDPLAGIMIDATSYYAIDLWYSDVPSTGTGRLRKMQFQQSLATEALETFAGWWGNDIEN